MWCRSKVSNPATPQSEGCSFHLLPYGMNGKNKDSTACPAVSTLFCYKTHSQGVLPRCGHLSVPKFLVILRARLVHRAEEFNLTLPAFHGRRYNVYLPGMNGTCAYLYNTKVATIHGNRTHFLRPWCILEESNLLLLPCQESVLTDELRMLV